MNGTKKQIEWAEKIKTRRLADLEKLEALPIPGDHPAAKALVIIREKYDTNIDDAAWWIEHDQTAIQVHGLANDIIKSGWDNWPW